MPSAGNLPWLFFINPLYAQFNSVGNPFHYQIFCTPSTNTISFYIVGILIYLFFSHVKWTNLSQFLSHEIVWITLYLRACSTLRSTFVQTKVTDSARGQTWECSHTKRTYLLWSHQRNSNILRQNYAKYHGRAVDTWGGVIYVLSWETQTARWIQQCIGNRQTQVDTWTSIPATHQQQSKGLSRASS